MPSMEDGWKCTTSNHGENCAERPFECIKCPFYKPYIRTLEGNLCIAPDDYIVTGIKGERYPVKKDIFEQTYEKID